MSSIHASAHNPTWTSRIRGKEDRNDDGHGPMFRKRTPRKGSTAKQARILQPEEIEQVLCYIRTNSNSPLSDEAKVLLSFFAGLRSCEIATLSIDDVCDASGRIGNAIIVRGANTKNGLTRSIPMHPRIKAVLEQLRAAHPDATQISFSHRFRIKQQSVHTVTCWFHWLYKKAGLTGCSSHSGRRTFITNLARSANQHNKSLRDVQRLAGHSRLDTTERYIDPAEDLSDFVNSLGAKPANASRSTISLSGKECNS